MSASAKKPYLLAIDDNPDSGALVARIAERQGYDALAVSDPRRVLPLIAERKPDVLALDLCMPQLDAIELLGTLGSIGFNGHIVIISGQDKSIISVAARLAHVRGIKVIDTLQKPVEVNELREVLAVLQRLSAA